MKWALLALALSASPAMAETYHLIAKVDPGVMFIDSDSIRRTPGAAQVWTTVFLFDDGDGSAVSKGTAFLMTHDEVDCQGDRLRYLQLQGYDAKGKPTSQVGQAQPWQDIIPGSNSAIEQRLVCDQGFLAADQALPSEALPMLGAVRRARDSFK